MLPAKEGAVRKPELLQQIRLFAGHFAKVDNPSLMIGQVGQFRSDQVHLRATRLVSDQVTSHVFPLRRSLQNNPNLAGFLSFGEFIQIILKPLLHLGLRGR